MTLKNRFCSINTDHGSRCRVHYVMFCRALRFHICKKTCCLGVRALLQTCLVSLIAGLKSPLTVQGRICRSALRPYIQAPSFSDAELMFAALNHELHSCHWAISRWAVVDGGFFWRGRLHLLGLQCAAVRFIVTAEIKKKQTDLFVLFAAELLAGNPTEERLQICFCF